MGESVVVEQVSEVGRGPIMEGIVGEEKHFKLDVLGNREQMKVLEERGDGITGVGEETGSEVLKCTEVY